MEDKKKIFIGNLSYGTTKDTLVELFLKFGQINDAYKPEGKGFAFITFETEEQAQNAIEAMNGQEVEGREIVVNISRPKEKRPFDRNFRGGNGGNGGRNFNRGGGNFDRNRDNRNRY